MQPHIEKINKRIYTGIAEKASELVDSDHWFNQLDIGAKTEWLYSKIHWSADKQTILEQLNK